MKKIGMGLVALFITGFVQVNSFAQERSIKEIKLIDYTAHGMESTSFFPEKYESIQQDRYRLECVGSEDSGAPWIVDMTQYQVLALNDMSGKYETISGPRKVKYGFKTVEECFALNNAAKEKIKNGEPAILLLNPDSRSVLGLKR